MGKVGIELKLAVWWLFSTLPKLNLLMYFYIIELHQTIAYHQILIHQLFKKQFLSIPSNIMTVNISSYLVYTVVWEKFSMKKFLLDATYDEN